MDIAFKFALKDFEIETFLSKELFNKDVTLHIFKDNLIFSLLTLNVFTFSNGKKVQTTGIHCNCMEGGRAAKSGKIYPFLL